MTTSEQIHQEISTIFDLSIKEKWDKETSKEGLLDQYNLAHSLGFTGSFGNHNLRQIEQNKQNILLSKEAQFYFNIHYPFNKFIDQNSLDSVCEKYDLYYAQADRYIGDIPMKNLLEIKNFKIREQDVCYQIREVWKPTSYAVTNKEKTYFSNIKVKNTYLWEREHSDKDIYCQKLGFIIAAPFKDFHGIKKRENSRELDIEDPIVLHPVFHNNRRYFLIVSMWGPEASDEHLINPIFN